MRIPDSQPQSSPTEGALPQSLQFMLSSIESTLKRSFSSRPPHTIQRLAELILRPTRHYRTLPAYLRALDRVVSVSSGADIFPLPLAVPPSVTVDGSLSNGVNGAGTSFSLFNDSSLGSDESLGGALLTPIPWLSNATPPPSNEDWPPQPGTSADILSAGTSAQNEASSQEENPIETKPDTTDAQHPPRDEKIPHARGPSIIGVEDMGLQDGNDVQMTLLASEPAEVSTQNQLASEEKEGEKSASASLEEDGDGDIVIGDVSAASEAQSSTTTATPSNEATKTEPAEADSAGDERKGIASDDPAKIDKLSILGVRSFDNTRSETIQFHTPLTLIVGYNGSGKTTIIECLKYATTGDLPPNSKGGAFIHDPKLCGEKEVLAQVKLAFKATSGAKMVITRSLQLTVKKTTRQQKTLEGQLLMVKEGERTAISSRVAELDQIMPQYLGVSKAILDNVIFCHQDESLWPLSEPSVLKKKFDEIFEAQKYTKAIDNIKALRKKQNEDLAKYKIMEQYAREDKDKADRAEKRSIELQEQIETIRAKAQELSKEMKRTAELADKAWKQSESYAEVLGALEGKRIEAKSIQKSIDNLNEHLVEVDESEEWLQSTLEQFESRQAEYREQEKSLKEKYVDLKEKIEGNRHQLGFKQAECGKHENDKAQFERQVERRTKLIRDIARQNNLRGFEGELDEMEISEFMQRIQKLSKERNQALERAKREAQTELREAQSLLNQLSQRKSALQEVKNAARKQISQNDKEADSYQRRLNEIDIDEGKIAILESRIGDTESRLHQAKEKARTASWEKDIQTKNTELRSLEEEGAVLNAELIEGTKKAGELARLDHLKRELKDRERSLETMTSAHGDKISQLISQTWNPSSIEQEYQAVLGAAATSLTNSERERDGASRELEYIEVTLKNARKSLQQHKKELEDCVERIREATDDEPEEYPEIVRQKQAHLDMVKKDLDQYAGLGDYLSKCLDAARQKKVCRTCGRGFRTQKEFEDFKSTLESLVKKATMNADDENVEQLEEDLEIARNASTYYDTWVRLSNTTIPEAGKEVARLESQREELLAKVEDHDRIVSEKGESKRDIEFLSKTVPTIAKYESDIKAFSAQIQDLSAKQQGLGVSRTLEDVQDTIATIGEECRELKRMITKITNERDQSRIETTELELQLRDVRSELDNAKFQLDKKASLETRLEEYRSLNAKQRESIEKADNDIENLVPEVSKAQAKFDDISGRGEQKERELQRDVSNLSDSLHQLDLATEDIISYNDRDGPRQLERSKREVENITKEIEHLETEQGSITRQLNAVSARLKDSENTKRQYLDNLQYRRDMRALEEVKAEIRRLEGQNAEVDRSRFREESSRRTQEYNAFSALHASKMGEMKARDNQLMQLLSDWNTDYKDAAFKFKEAHIKVETTKAAVDDLGKYGGALDKAIMKYHGLKMEEINRIIGELWQKTYRGTDVDTILIRSDNENAKGNRSYNYRVVMVKQDAEMDMRGRCSAGQKVLASIIIRLALAECFGVSCGLIALDEPTTNLDRDNIRSLAGALHDIIRARQQQANFQLIVITHDEEFLRNMQCGDFSDYYYRVSRNERQKSIIERQSIAEVRRFAIGGVKHLLMYWDFIGYVKKFELTALDESSPSEFGELLRQTS
ncbi:DNA repair protein rad50 [Emydomyces testavorans]|uniref:DNA repair protein RAD50 n=1 Tax=Emydomyces testavorans TaxID=2070801 RepID=A0AAF0DFG1_9EURO|nr:DNA repair protein rad50 [Emydomyces testavorans]